MGKSKIVLIEDDKILSKVLYEELGEAGFEVFQAFDGEEGLALVNSKTPNLVLLDILMPKKNGFEVMEAMNASPATNAIPVIMLTMLGRDDDIKKGIQLGAKDYIVKSQHAVAEIIEKVKSFFDGQETQSTPTSTVTPASPEAPEAPSSPLQTPSPEPMEPIPPTPPIPPAQTPPAQSPPTPPASPSPTPSQ